MAIETATLDADDETYELDVAAGEEGVASMSISGTITVTWTYRPTGGSTFVPLKKQDGTTAAAYTASEPISFNMPGTYKATASGTSGGSCGIEANSYRVNGL